MSFTGVLSLNGRVFIGTSITDTAGAGGTELLGIDAEEITLVSGQQSVSEFLNNLKSSWRDVDAETLLSFSLQEMTALALKLRYPGLTADGAKFGPDLGTKIGQEHAEYNLLIIPQDSSVDFRFFAKRVSIHVESADQILWSPMRPLPADAQLILQVNGDAGDTEPAWRLETAAQLAADYAALSTP